MTIKRLFRRHLTTTILKSCEPLDIGIEETRDKKIMKAAIKAKTKSL